ncbi:hypothetical protein [Mesorhizobium erdmanii]|uniref:Uncharacterized protein n=1 Tax=Mesorhizobium erdmanii TaxID=1777866 RepID=A0A6M7UHR8_9HYPH|nr:MULTISPECIES: hypothetical protein [Mesorhizobium]OBQ69712.1 hypothetical protein A8146_29615 [Mesorhizobium loti]QKC75297.1 hypothetical protein EB233_06870 [Mesorhizobium erdmanii]
MPYHCKDSDFSRGVSHHHVLASMIVVRLSFVAPLLPTALDTGDADEFSFGKAGGSACFRGISPCEQGKATVAS